MEPEAPYYGNIVRKLFIICGLVILITLPFLKTLISGPIFYSLLAVIILTFTAGITSPKYKKSILVDIIVSIVGFGLFAYQGIIAFSGFLNLFFITNLTLAILFLFAFYWCIKTARGIKFSREDVIGPRIERQTIINASEDSPASPKKELTEEELRRKRFLGAED